MVSSKFNRTLIILFLFTLFLFIPKSQVLADSAYVDLLIPGSSQEIGAGQMTLEGQFSVHNGTGHYWNAGSGYHTIDLSTGAVTDMGAPSWVQTNGYGDPFGVYDPYSNAFYAGSYLNGASSYLYKYDYNTSTWSEGLGAINLYGADVYQGELYISGLREPWSGGFDTNYISLFDFSGNANHDALIETGGASAHVALDRDGNVYYAPYEFGGTALYRWTADQVNSVRNDLAGGAEDTYLTLADGEKLTDLPGSANGITVDDAGHVFVTDNNYPSSQLMMWNGIAGEGDNYDVIGVNPDGSFAWFGPMDIEGDFTQGASLYGSFGFGSPLTEVTASPVPVPAAFWLLGSGLIGLIGIHRRGK